ncbi:multidrug effflux MFS transporter [Alkalihalobacillus oceani]|uniref:Bcr/CflA family efflux transporter n=1 Tax=Halalkalibacter oceani TaxID=1653776 RepID=A0A9X2DPZ8_9BACI|nr:multidrug effflux MFS transporter [Halalkalibacter oceani]MCM3713740.1 multidrug effflux MFS transporter [Halalkalibacter oceani]
MEKEAAASRMSRGMFIVMLGALSAFGPLTIDMYLPAFPAMAEHLQTPASTIQLSLTACLLGLAVGQMVVGPLSDIHGRRKPLIIALTVYAVASLLCAFAPSIWLLVLLRFVQGAAGAAGMVISRACVRDRYSGSEMTKIFSLLVLIMGVAPIFAPVLGGFLLQYVSWRGIFVALSVLGAVMLLLITWRLPETLGEESRSTGGIGETLAVFKRLLKDRLFMSYALIVGLASGGMFAYISGSPFVLQDLFRVSPQMYSIIFGVNALGLIIASQVTGRFADRVPEIRFLFIGLLLLVSGGVILSVVVFMEAGLLALLVALFLTVSSIGFINPSGVSLAMKSQGSHAGSASALLGLVQFSIGGAMAPLVGIAGATALPMGLIILLCSAAALFVYQFGLRKTIAAKTLQTKKVM